MISPDFWVDLLWHSLATTPLAAVVYLVRRVTARQSLRDRFIGWVVFGTSVGGFFASGLFVGVTLCSPPILDWLGKAAFGFFGGVVSGNLLGWLVWWYYRREIERNEDA
jgi:hypothetical protein